MADGLRPWAEIKKEILAHCSHSAVERTRAARSDVIAQMRTLVDKADGRALTAEEHRAWDVLSKEAEYLERQLQRAQGVLPLSLSVEPLKVEIDANGVETITEARLHSVSPAPQAATPGGRIVPLQWQKELINNVMAGNRLHLNMGRGRPPIPKERIDEIAKLFALNPELIGELTTPTVERERTFGVEPLVGWRVWRVKSYRLLDGRFEYRLAPIADRPLWHPHVRTTAVCTAHTDLFGGDLGGIDEHEAPDPDCSCGLWAVDRSTAERMYASKNASAEICVFGTIKMWGRVLEFEKGYRAQHAYPYELYGYTDHEEMLRSLGELYGVPVRILPGRIAPRDPDQQIGQHRRAIINIGASSAQAAKEVQKMSEAIKKLAASMPSSAPMIVSPNEYRKLLGFPVITSEEKDVDAVDFVALANHAAGGEHVFDVYRHAAAAQFGVQQFIAHLEAEKIKHRRVQRWRITFPSGGSYDAIPAGNEDQLMRRLRGTRPGLIDLPPGVSPRLQSYLRARGATILP